jgi:DNA helicase HerA-like ATPase
MLNLFAKSQLWGTFKGFCDKGFEFAADIICPYNSSMQDRPQLGQFLLVQLGTPEEASLGRITKFIPSGLLATAEGEDYINTLQERDQEVPEDLKSVKLKYKVQIKLLGAVKIVNEDIVYVPSQRRLPHLGAKVALPSDAVLKKLCQLSSGETDLGDYVLGEFVYSGRNSEPESMFRHISPQLGVTFDINNLVSKRTVVFARAGYGKSNLIKYLIGELYRNGVPKTDRGRKVGVLIFDADGEYFWPDFKNRPGLCDVGQLQEHLVVFTSRIAPSEYYNSWKSGDVKVDIRKLLARDVIGIAISADRQNQQNVIKLKSLNSEKWSSLVDLIKKDGLSADDSAVGKLLGYDNDRDVKNSAAEVSAAKSNMYNVVTHLFDPNSQLINGTIDALKEGCCDVVDISMLSSSAGYYIAGLLLRKIFNYNQEQFTGESQIPVISIIEEAQSVLRKNLEESNPFVEWVKEGRKYDLGAVLVTQQPGSMPSELLSQSDNWFCFHLLSEGDAGTLGKYNSHFSHDILAHLIGEPIQGNCYMWSAPKQPFVLPVRIRSFEETYGKNVDKDRNKESFPKSAAIVIKENSETRDKFLAETLLVKIKEDRPKLKSFDNDMLGIYDGQLYIFLKNILDTDAFKGEHRKIDELRLPLLKIILNTDNVSIIKGKHEKKKEVVNYYCTHKANWDKILQSK